MLYSLTVTNSIGESMTLELSNPWASGYAIKNIDGLGTPDMNVNTTPYGIGDGSVLGSIKAEYRLITIVLYPLALPTVETARQRLYRYFQIKKPVMLTFNTEHRLVDITGYVQKIEANIFDNPESISIEIKCINPYFHKMSNDQTKFYGIAPLFEFVFSNEFIPGFLSWEEFSLPSSNGCIAFAQGNGLYMLINNEHKVLYSEDGIEWSEANLDFGRKWILLAFGSGVFVAMAEDLDDIMYSSDGEDWIGVYNGRVIPSSLISGDGQFVAVGVRDNGTSNTFLYSLDGKAWVKRLAGDITGWNRLAFAGDMFFGWGAQYQPCYSVSFPTWTDMNLPVRDWCGMAYDGNRYFALSADGKSFYNSADGVDWIEAKFPFLDQKWISISGVNGRLIAIGPNVVITSTDSGETWSQINTPVSQKWGYTQVIDGKIHMIPSVGSKILIGPEEKVEYLEPIEFSMFTIDNRMTIEYEGEIDAGIKITIECQSPPGDIIIYNVETLQYIQIFAERVEAASGSPLGPKDIIEINTDPGEKYVRLLRNGIYYNILGAMNRGMTWFVLKQGPNTFTYTTTDEHAAISMTFSYRDTYAAI